MPVTVRSAIWSPVRVDASVERTAAAGSVRCMSLVLALSRAIPSTFEWSSATGSCDSCW